MPSRGDWDPRLRQLGEYIRMRRRMAQLSLRGLSELAQVSNAYLSQLERGLHQPSSGYCTRSPTRSMFPPRR
jgi:predicted transcriptional regulator